MVTAHAADAALFNNNGLGVLQPIAAEVYEEINGRFELDMTLTVEDAVLVDVGGIIVADTHRGRQPFRVVRVDKYSRQTVGVYAMHLSYDLLGGMIENRAPTETNATLALDAALDGTAYGGTSDVPGTASARWVRKSPLAAIMGEEDNAIIHRWGGEIERDGYTINIKQRLGADRGVEIRYRKNLTGLAATVDISNVVTRIYPTGLSEEITSVIALPEKYIESARINDYPTVRSKHIHYSHIQVGSEEYPDEATAQQALRDAVAAEYAAGVDLPLVSLDIKFVDLSQTDEYKDFAVLERVYLGDTVRCYHAPLGVDVSLRAVTVRWDALRQRYAEITLGQPIKNTVDALREQAAAIPILTEKQTALQAATEAATALLISPGTSYVRFYPSISNPSEILIMDNEDAQAAQNVTRWNSAGWGISVTGIAGPYIQAATAAGINASVVTAGTMLFERLQGGTLALGGAANGNGIALIKDADGKRRLQIDNRGIGFYDSSENWLTTLATTTENKTLHVGAGQPYATIQAALDTLPMYINHAISVTVHAGTYAEDVRVQRFSGSGQLFVQRNGSDAVNVHSIQLYACQLRTLEIDGFTLTNTAGAALSVVVCPNVWLKNLSVTAAASHDGIQLWSGSKGTIRNCTVSNRYTGLYIAESCEADVQNIAGTGNTTGIVCSASIMHDTGGNSITGTQTRETTAGGIILPPSGYMAMPGADGWVRVAEPWIYASPTTITVPSGALNKYRKYDKVKLWQAGLGPKFYYITNVSDTLLTVDPADMGTGTLSNAAIDPDHNYSRELQPTGWPDGAERMPRLDVYDSFSVGGKDHYMYFESDENASPPGLQIWGPSEFNGDVTIWGGARIDGKLLWSGTWTGGNISAPGIHLYKNFLIKPPRMPESPCGHRACPAILLCWVTAGGERCR